MKRWDVQSMTIEEMRNQLIEPATLLRQGGLVAFPTETVYGLGANAYQEDAVRGIFKAKGRPSDNPLIVHIADISMLHQVTPSPAQLPRPVVIAMETFWPGPLTVLVPSHPEIAASVRPGLANVGVRVPAHPVAQALLQLAGCPVAAPSANLSGKPSPTSAGDVWEDLNGRIDGVVDGGPCAVGVESTVVAIDEHQAVIYRPGGITQEQLQDALQIPVVFDDHLTSPEQAPKAPGMKYRHYAPNAKVHVWWGSEPRILEAFSNFLSDHAREPVACIVPATLGDALSTTTYVWAAPAGEAYEVALSRALYGLLRAFDRQGVHHILIAGVPPTDYGVAVMNRLQKAAEGRLHPV
jgi:L-threonylcarbamoyladenylate synthase